MLQRQSTLFLPTLREDPADAEAVSHKLLVRAGLIRQVGAGLWTYLPAGWRLHERVVQIVREEMNAIGGQEMSMPVLTPAELWKKTGRYDTFDVLMKVRDSADREFVLAATHEETITFHARELRSYRDLPKILYHFQTKEREEPRPRGGLLRVREFVMKDSYSFDRDEEGLDVSFQAHKAAYDRVFERCGLEVQAVEAESGMMGGNYSVDYLAPSGSGENTLVTCERGDYAADLEIAHGVPRAPSFPDPLDAPAEVETPGIETCEDLARFLEIDLAATAKAMPVVAGGEVVLALVRGDDRLDEGKLAAALGSPVRPAQVDEIREAFGAEPGSLGPVQFGGRIVLDETMRDGQFVAGANRTGFHLRGVQHRRDFEAQTTADIRLSREGDRCPRCGGALRFQTAIEVGHIFKLGTFHSVPLDATYLDEESVERPIVMGSYGIGPGRVLAALVEQRHDDRGILWPRSIAPYDVHLLSLAGGSEEVEALALELANDLSGAGFDVLLDDRDARPGEKFADADLLGCPLRVTMGRKSLDDGAVDVRRREDSEDARVARSSVIDWVSQD